VREWTFEVPGPPVAWQRPRTNGRRRWVDPKTRAFEDAVALVAMGAVGSAAPLDGPLEVLFQAILPRPQRLRRKTDPDGLIPAPVKPDVDNLAKGILDGLAAIWADDAQVCSMVGLKLYAERDGQPRTRITVRVFQWNTPGLG
jgi:Holliday junction resolvase RusA-like endonuclease